MAVRLHLGDTGRSITDIIKVDGQVQDLTGATVKLQARAVGSSTLTIDAAATVVPPATSGQVSYTPVSGDVDNAGEFLARWLVTLPSGPISSPEFLLVVDDFGVTSTDLVTAEEVVEADPALESAWPEVAGIVLGAITQASEAILDYTGRRFVPTDGAGTVALLEARRAFNPIDRVVMLPDAAAAPSLIRFLDRDAATVAATLTSGDWLAHPLVRRTQDPVTGVLLLPGTQDPAWFIEVTARWGFPTVPGPVRRAAVITVVHWLRDSRALTTQSPLQLEAGDVPQRALPQAAMDLLRPYRRIGVA